MELEDRILSQVNNALDKAVRDELVGYNKPLSNMVSQVISDNRDDLYELINSEFVKMLDAGSFREALKKALNEKLAKILISRMGGELEKQVNVLKGNPETRARITLAITDIIKVLEKNNG